jgi:hypothetical protein
LGLGLAGLLIPGLPGPASAETYSVQVGMYQNVKNAEKQFTALQKKKPALPLDFLRIEKSGNRFALRVGKFGDRAEALLLLSRLTPAYPQAFIWKGDWEKRNIVRLVNARTSPKPAEPRGVPESRESPSPTRSAVVRDPAVPLTGEAAEAPGDKKAGPSTDKPSPASADSGLTANRAVLFGTILDVVILPSMQPGFSPAKEWLRLVIQVEATTEVKGYPNYLQGKEGGPLTFFTENRSPLFKPGNKVRALVEYRGDKNSRFFWIIKPEPPSP